MSTVSDALAAIAAGEIVLVVDDEQRENEGDLIMAAEYATTESVAFFLEHTSGFLCVAIDESRATALELGPMVPQNTDRHRTAFLVSVDYRHGTSTGISAGDRAATVRALADLDTAPADLARPGHVLPLRARPGGVLERPGHTEAGVDLCKLAGLSGAALLCEIVSPDRRDMMRGADLVDFATAHGMPIISVAALQEWRRDHDPVTVPSEGIVTRTGQSTLPTEVGDFQAIAYRAGDVEHLVLVSGDLAAAEAPLVRLHSECLTGDLAGSLRCDCGAQFRSALSALSRSEAGIMIYLRGQEGRGIGLGHKLRAYELQLHEGLDTVDANLSLGFPVDSRDYRAACEILDDLGVRRVRLLTNNPDKTEALRAHGIAAEQVAHESLPTPQNLGYLTAKRDRLGHTLQRLS